MSYEKDPLWWILDKYPGGKFVSEYLGKKHLLCKTDRRDRFRTLLTFEQLDEIFGTFGLRFPDVVLVRSESDVRPKEYAWKTDMVDPMRAARLFAGGALHQALLSAAEDLRSGSQEVTRNVCTS